MLIELLAKNSYGIVLPPSPYLIKNEYGPIFFKGFINCWILASDGGEHD